MPLPKVVYRARRPFHPARFWETIKEVFVVIQAEYIDDGIEQPGDDAKAEEESDEEAMDADGDNEDEGMDCDESQPQLNPQARLESKRASPTFSPLLRSKGFVWLATRPKLYGELSQAGVMLTLTGGQRWRCEVPRDEWPSDADVVRAIEKDFDGSWGDRRQGKWHLPLSYFGSITDTIRPEM